MTRKTNATPPDEASCEGTGTETTATYLPRSVDYRGGGLTRELIAAFAGIVAAGHRRTVACSRLGIPWATYNNWRIKGQGAIRRFAAKELEAITLEADFVRIVDEAEAECHMEIVDRILSSDDPTILLRYLKARWPKHYHHDGRTIVDDDAAEEVSRESPMDLLSQRLRQLMPQPPALPESDDE